MKRKGRQKVLIANEANAVVKAINKYMDENPHISRLEAIANVMDVLTRHAQLHCKYQE